MQGENAIVILTILFIAGIAQGVTGFGYALLSGPLLLLFLKPSDMVVVFGLLSVVINMYLTIRIREKTDISKLIRFLAPSIAGLPVGVWAVTAVPQNILKILAAVISLTLMILSLHKKRIRISKAAEIAAGFAAGVLQTGAGFNGPLVSAVFLSKGYGKTEIRKLMAVLFSVLSILSVPLFASGGLLTGRHLFMAVVAAPGLILGSYIGDKIAGKLPGSMFNIICLGVTFLSSAILIFSLLGN